MGPDNPLTKNSKLARPSASVIHIRINYIPPLAAADNDNDVLSRAPESVMDVARSLSFLCPRQPRHDDRDVRCSMLSRKAESVVEMAFLAVIKWQSERDESKKRIHESFGETSKRQPQRDNSIRH